MLKPTLDERHLTISEVLHRMLLFPAAQAPPESLMRLRRVPAVVPISFFVLSLLFNTIFSIESYHSTVCMSRGVDENPGL